MLAKKYKRLINYVIGPVLFVLLTVSIYQKLNKRGDLATSWQHIRQLFTQHYYLLSILFGLMFVNWGLEALKWKTLIQPVQKVSFWRAFKAILSGLSFSLFIPNGTGEYIGRMFYMEEGKKLRSLPVSIIGSIAQVLITLIAGLIGVAYLFHHLGAEKLQLKGLSMFWFGGILYAVGIGVIIVLIMYFKVSLFTHWLIKIPFVRKNKIFIESLEEYNGKILFKVLCIALIRYIIFILQYLLVFYLFGVNINGWMGAMSVSVLFLLLAIIPTIPIADIGVRSEASMQIFGLLSQNMIGIVSSAALIWLVNIIVPAVLGSIFMLGVKFFKDK